MDERTITVELEGAFHELVAYDDDRGIGVTGCSKGVGRMALMKYDPVTCTACLEDMAARATENS